MQKDFRFFKFRKSKSHFLELESYEKSFFKFSEKKISNANFGWNFSERKMFGGILLKSLGEPITAQKLPKLQKESLGMRKNYFFSIFGKNLGEIFFKTFGHFLLKKKFWQLFKKDRKSKFCLLEAK